MSLYDERMAGSTARIDCLMQLLGTKRRRYSENSSRGPWHGTRRNHCFNINLSISQYFLKFISKQEVETIQSQIGQGCQLFGHFFVKKVPGNFHISIHGKGMGILFLNKVLSAGHKINMLEFTTVLLDFQFWVILQQKEGELTYGGINGKNKFNLKIGLDSEYYLKIVTSDYVHPLWGTQPFYQYSYTETNVDRDPNVPKVEFKYDFDPISMRYKKKRSSLLELMTSLCAIIGGLFAFSTMLNYFVS